MSNGIFLVDFDGQVTWSNWPAVSDPQDSVRIAQGRIVTVSLKDQKALNEALLQVLKATSGRPMPLTVNIRDHRTGGILHVIHIVPMHRPAANTGPASLAASATDVSAPIRQPLGAMVFVADPTRSVTVTPQLLETQLGLSPSEARVAARIAAGDRPRELAVSLGLTEDSARVILKRVFAKTSVSRQSELVALISGITSMPMH